MGSKVVMPQLGESVVEGKISKWLKQVGDKVALYDPILEVETDKVTTEVTAAGEGTLLKTYVDEGDVVQVGAMVAYIGQMGEAPPAGDAPDEAASARQPEPIAAPAAALAPGESAYVPRPVVAGNGKRVSPVVARIAAEHHVDVADVPGTGLDGRVTKKDILAYIERGDSAATTPAPWEQPGLGELFRPSE